MALDTMGLIGGTDHLGEISMRLEESHLAYLQLDESPLKLQARQKLEGFIKEYLCHVPNERKYVFQETADILHRSAATVKDFSGYRACTAWRSLSLYAANLLAQPWRKEYRTLRTYSGYYKHEIEANLIGGELMFELMGYKHTGLGILTLEGPIDPDRVSNVSRDAIVAFVECQILMEIWEKVSQKFTITWLEVLEFRCNSVGTSEQAIRALNFRFHERLHHSREKNSSNAYRDYANVRPVAYETAMIAPIVPPIISHRAITKNSSPTIIQNVRAQPESIYHPSDVNYIYFTPTDASLNLTNRCFDPYACGATIGHYYPTGHDQTTNDIAIPLIAGQATRVPTGRLIELDAAPLPVADYAKNRSILHDISNRASAKSRRCDERLADEIDSRAAADAPSPFAESRYDYAKIDKRAIGKFAPENNDNRDNNWEFVYKNLESRGYSKDLGERDDVLMSKELRRKNFHSLANVVPPRDDRYEKYERKRDEKRIVLSGSAADRAENFNLRTVERSNGQANHWSDSLEYRKKIPSVIQDSRLAGSCDPRTDAISSIYEKNDEKYGNSSTRNVHEDIDENADNAVAMTRTNLGDNGESWDCGTCTFLNSREREICEMCGKSRRKGNEDKPLASGGKECPQCTLVNEKNSISCEACRASLKDSPTYI